MTDPRLVVTPLKNLVIQLVQLTNWSCGHKWGDIRNKLDIPDLLIWKVFLCSHVLPHWPNPQLEMQNHHPSSSPVTMCGWSSATQWWLWGWWWPTARCCRWLALRLSILQRVFPSLLLTTLWSMWSDGHFQLRRQKLREVNTIFQGSDTVLNLNPFLVSKSSLIFDYFFIYHHHHYFHLGFLRHGLTL